MLHFRYFFVTLLTLSVTLTYAQNKKDKPDILENYRQTFWNNLPKPLGWVNDFELIYTENEERYLDSLITVYEKETGIEIAIITLDTSCVAKENFDALSLRFAKTWGIGKKDKNNGVVIVISKGYRVMRIQNGLGIEMLMSDEETKVIIDKYFVPSFKKGQYYHGTLTGLTELMNFLNSKIK